MQAFDWPMFLLGTVWLLPLLGAFIVIAFNRADEYVLSWIVRVIKWSYLGVVISLFIYWSVGDFETLLFRYPLEIGWKNYSIDYAVQFDLIAATFLAMTTFCGLTVVRFSRTYLHREQGYARFFALILLLVTGMSILSIADNMTIFFAGWEFVGLASFFLVAFYRRRSASVWNALKIFAVYRFGDLGLIICVVIMHMLSTVGGHTLFSTLSPEYLPTYFTDSALSPLLAFGIVVAATVKSAQVPFSFWLPRAMEGPTPSSAIFYGALAVHAGVLLLLRMAPFWSEVPGARMAIAGIGLMTIVVTTISGRVQSSIKAQLAYASTTQVGIMFVELACGFDRLVLFHFVAHALLRSFQILLSPSIISTFMQMQLSEERNLQFSSWSWEKILPRRLRSSFYVFGIQGGFLEFFWEKLLIRPVKWLINTDEKMTGRWRIVVIAGLGVIGYLVGDYRQAVIFSLTGILLIKAVRACFTLRRFAYATDEVMQAFLLAGIITTLIGHNFDPLVAVSLGIMPFWVAIRYLLSRSLDAELKLGFRGQFETQPLRMWLLVVAICGFVGLPPLPGFLAEDILMEPIIHQFSIVSLGVGLSLALNGIAMFRGIALLGMGTPTR